MSRQEIKEQYRKNTATDQFMLRHKEKYKAKSMSRHKSSCRDTDYCNLEILLRHCMKKLCRNKLMNVVTLEDKVSGLDREIKLRQVMLTW